MPHPHAEGPELRDREHVFSPLARFDDFSAGLSLAFAKPSLASPILVATRPDEVVDVLRTVSHATEGGSWAVGFVSYEAAAGLDSGLPARPPTAGAAQSDLPLAWFCLFDSPSSVEPLLRSTHAGHVYSVGPWRPDWTPSEYAGKLDVVRDEIAAGNTYQCNLTTRLRSQVRGDLFGLYRDMALAQSGAHNVYLDTGGFVIASASPELFFDWTGDRLTTRPMKGSAKRGRWAAEDIAVGKGLAVSPKDRAENLMIVDLIRNDLGKLAEWGSVEVPALFEVERYPTLWQLTSTVTARPRPGTTLVDVFEALFPSGSVTGAPKRSTMSLIAQLEDSPRGVYCGAIGIVAPPGAPFRARFNVAIRTVVVERATGEAVYGTGSGITWDSTASSEHAELIAKAAILAPRQEEFSLLETLGYWPGEGLRNQDLHLERLAGSAAYFGFPLDLTRLRADLDAALSSMDGPRRVRIVVPPSGPVALEVGPMPAPLERPTVLAIDPEPVDLNETWLYHKTTRRSTYDKRVVRHPEADDVIMVNELGEVTESSIANLAVRLGGRWLTPPVESGCLPGVERARLIQEGRLTEARVTLEDLATARDIALVSSLRGWREATLLAGSREEEARHLGAPS
ncbi:MAG TPA: aminodeoxychorismate synthase component I [Candidatus Dormibacteraeota bacterium]|nr:aminodeoxychorismate synthase component I [Candidatus Dormibacteraeota bacterium]